MKVFYRHPRQKSCCLIISLLLFPLLSLAQQKEITSTPADTNRLGTPPPETPISPINDAPANLFSPSFRPQQIPLPVQPKFGADSTVQLHLQPFMPSFYIDPFTGDYNTGGIAWQYRRQAIVGSGARNTVPGMGGSGFANISYLFLPTDRLQLSIGATVEKYDFLNFSSADLGISGALHYRINDKISFNAFGTYFFNNPYNNMSTQAYIRSSYYGASMSFEVHEHFGFDLGAQRYFNARNGQWETVPIITPYIILNNKQRIGIDLGGLFQLFKQDSYDQPQPTAPESKFKKGDAQPSTPRRW